MNGTWLLPTLNRPHLLKTFLDSYKATHGSTPGMILIDKHDPAKEEYFQIHLPTGWHIVLTDAVTMGDKVREVWDQIKDLDWVGILNDDHRAVTHEWDKKVVSRIKGHNIVCTNDNYVAPNRICGAICFSGKILRTLGWMFPQGLQHLYSDDVWMALFGKAQCAELLMDVTVSHDHAYKDKSKQDETFFKINGEQGLVNGQGLGGLWPEDKRVFEAWMKNDYQKDLAKIMALQPKSGLMIATPSHSGDCALDYALGLTDLSIFLTQNNIYFEMARVVGSSLIPHARNSLVDMFLQSRCQKLLFMDSDQGYTKESVMPLYHSTKKLIAGVVPHKRFPINLNFEPLEQDKFFFKDLSNKSVEEFRVFAQARCDSSGEVEVNRAGSGFMMIDRSVFEAMRDKVEKYQAFDNNEEIHHSEYFLMGAMKNKYRGEDWRFGELAKELGIPIYINARSTATHRGGYTFDIGKPV